MNNHILINQDSGNTEYYTPTNIVNASRNTMGGIDLDPFSSYTANKRVKAENFYSKEENGWDQQWYGNIWMNHPFSRENNKALNYKIEREMCNFKSLCFITFAATSEAWFRPFLKYPQCFLEGRTNYYLPDGTKKTGVTKGSIVTYIGPNIDKFYDNFKDLGEVKVTYK